MFRGKVWVGTGLGLLRVVTRPGLSSGGEGELERVLLCCGAEAAKGVHLAQGSCLGAVGGSGSERGSREPGASRKFNGEAMDGEGEDGREGPIVHVGGPHSSSSVFPAP